MRIIRIMSTTIRIDQSILTGIDADIVIFQMSALEYVTCQLSHYEHTMKACCGLSAHHTFALCC